MGGTQARRLLFGFDRLAAQQLGKATLNELVLGLAVERRFIVTVQDTLGHDEQGYLPGSSGCHVDRDGTTHAVTDETALREGEAVDEGDDRARVAFKAVPEVDGLSL